MHFLRFHHEKPSLRETTPLVAVTRGKVVSGWD